MLIFSLLISFKVCSTSQITDCHRLSTSTKQRKLSVCNHRCSECGRASGTLLFRRFSPNGDSALVSTWCLWRSFLDLKSEFLSCHESFTYFNIYSVALDFSTESFYSKVYNFRESSRSPELTPWSSTSSRDYLYFEIVKRFGNSNDLVELKSRSGAHFIIHPGNELPDDSSYHFHQFYHHTIIEIYPRQTIASNEIKVMSVQQRNCHFDHEKVLELYNVYTKQNCEQECQSFAFAKRCNCVPFYLLSE